MQLSYRGVRYEYNPPKVEVTEGGIAGKYRGIAWRYHQAKPTSTR
jgi:hypothetical protein